MKGKLIQFIRTKDFKFIEEIGQGGTGRTVLLEDEIINERFICKKYSPFYPAHKIEFFDNFKDEIKLLHLLYHKNIVRVFNYYLYPEEHTGYILMEFIKGQNINSYLKSNPDKLNDIFKQTIDGFVHLEHSKILHRDIRPDNILISNEGIVKIIDFGFSKKIEFDKDYNKSISLNWRYVPPNDFNEHIYNFRTELYFIGKLFEEIITENSLQDFEYKELLKTMTQIDYAKRIPSFFDVHRKILTEDTPKKSFTKEEKSIYRNFANELENIFSSINYNAEYITDLSLILSSIQQVYHNSILEDILQNEVNLAQCFVKGEYSYWKNKGIPVDTIANFYSFLNSSSKENQKIILNNLWQRLDKIARTSPDPDDDLPF